MVLRVAIIVYVLVGDQRLPIVVGEFNFLQLVNRCRWVAFQPVYELACHYVISKN
jgi:hypothetical protein